MGRSAQGFSLLKRGKVWSVRFRVDGKRRELSTGQSTRTEAARVGQAIYARAIQGELGTSRSTEHRQCAELSELVSQWIEDHPLRNTTRVTYEKYGGYWVREFRSTHSLTDREIAAYTRKRLRTVRGKTVNSELCALRVFLRWLHELDFLPEVPNVPTVSKQTAGTAYHERRRTKAPELSPEEIEAILEELPEYSERIKFPIRARFEVAYDTTLRPETMARLKVPENWSPRCAELTLTAEDDKELYGRVVPLTARAVAALERVAPAEGLIFGAHRCGPYLQEAAKAVLPASKAAVFIGQHFRSAAITHFLELTGNLPGVMTMAGHKHASTTGRYVRPSLRAAKEMLEAAERVKIRVKNSKTG